MQDALDISDKLMTEEGIRWMIIDYTLENYQKQNNKFKVKFKKNI